MKPWVWLNPVIVGAPQANPESIGTGQGRNVARRPTSAGLAETGGRGEPPNPPGRLPASLQHRRRKDHRAGGEGGTSQGGASEVTPCTVGRRQQIVQSGVAEDRAFRFLAVLVFTRRCTFLAVLTAFLRSFGARGVLFDLSGAGDDLGRSTRPLCHGFYPSIPSRLHQSREPCSTRRIDTPSGLGR